MQYFYMYFVLSTRSAMIFKRYIYPIRIQRMQVYINFTLLQHVVPIFSLNYHIIFNNKRKQPDTLYD